MTNEETDYEALVNADEWKPMTPEKAFTLMMEIRDWRENRLQGGYDCRLLDGVISLAKKYIEEHRRK